MMTTIKALLAEGNERTERGIKIALKDCPYGTKDKVEEFLSQHYEKEQMYDILNTLYESVQTEYEEYIDYRVNGNHKGFYFVTPNGEQLVYPIIDVHITDINYPTLFSSDDCFTWKKFELTNGDDDGRTYYVGSIGRFGDPHWTVISFDERDRNEDNMTESIVNGKKVLVHLVLHKPGYQPRRFGRFTLPEWNYRDFLLFCRVTTPEADKYHGTDREGWMADIIFDRLIQYMAEHQGMSINEVQDRFRARIIGGELHYDAAVGRLPKTMFEEDGLDF